MHGRRFENLDMGRVFASGSGSCRRNSTRESICRTSARTLFAASRAQKTDARTTLAARTKQLVARLARCGPKISLTPTAIRRTLRNTRTISAITTTAAIRQEAIRRPGAIRLIHRCGGIIALRATQRRTSFRSLFSVKGARR